MKTIFVSVIILVYFLVLIVRRIVKGLYGTWMKKNYFYLEIKTYNKRIIRRVRCKRLGYILNPFANTMTLVLYPFYTRRLSDYSGLIYIKVYKNEFHKDGVYSIKSIKGLDTEKEIFLGLSTSYAKMKEINKGDVIFFNKRVMFKGVHETSTLEIYDYRYYTNRRIRQINGW